MLIVNSGRDASDAGMETSSGLPVADCRSPRRPPGLAGASPTGQVRRGLRGSVLDRVPRRIALARMETPLGLDAICARS
jgi:hypothetical protein